MQAVLKVFHAMVLVCVVFGTSSLASAEWVEWVVDPGVDYLYQDNVNLSSFKLDERSDHSAGVTLQAGRYSQIGEYTRLRLTAGFEAGFYDTYSKLNNVAFSGNISLTHKLGLGQNAGWVSPYLAVGHREVRDDIRSGLFTDVGINAGKRLTERFDMSAGLAYRKSEGKDGVVIVPGIGSDVFDQARWIVSLRGNYLLSSRLILQGELEHYDGEFVSACTTGNVGTVLAEENVKAITLDEVFGGCVYRLGGDGNSASLNLSYATGRHSSFSAGVSFLKGKAKTLEYDNTVFQVSFLYSY